LACRCPESCLGADRDFRWATAELASPGAPGPGRALRQRDAPLMAANRLMAQGAGMALSRAAHWGPPGEEARLLTVWPEAHLELVDAESVSRRPPEPALRRALQAARRLRERKALVLAPPVAPKALEQLRAAELQAPTLAQVLGASLGAEQGQRVSAPLALEPPVTQPDQAPAVLQPKVRLGQAVSWERRASQRMVLEQESQDACAPLWQPSRELPFPFARQLPQRLRLQPVR
jgi:hypothetical protein